MFQVNQRQIGVSCLREEFRFCHFTQSHNGTDHRGRASDCSIFEDVVAASGASDCYDLCASVCGVFAATPPNVTPQQAVQSSF
jgi:hypothetical protein